MRIGIAEVAFRERKSICIGKGKVESHSFRGARATPNEKISVARPRWAGLKLSVLRPNENARVAVGLRVNCSALLANILGGVGVGGRLEAAVF